MMLKVPYLNPKTIERDAIALLAEYARARDVVLVPPIPIEDIVEKHLKLGIDFDDTHSLFGVPRLGDKPDILGAMFFKEGRIVIDESLDPEEHPRMEGRYRFTLAHEGGGHWRLHRPYFESDSGEVDRFEGVSPKSFICRSSDVRVPVEWQADFYASCLLMPRDLVFAAWNEMFPDQMPRVFPQSQPVDHPFVEVPVVKFNIAGLKYADTAESAFENFAVPLARRFIVSPIAMRIRLEKLGLLLRRVPA